MHRNMEISPEGLLKRFSLHKNFNQWKDQLSTPQLSDALKSIIDYTPVIPGIKPLKNEYKILGKIVTVETSADDWGTVLTATDRAEKGDILFIKTDNDDSAVWGELASKNAQFKGIAGTVVYGAVRDVSAIRKLNYPVFTRSIVPNAGAPLGEGKVNIPLQCGNININPQDVILGDDCGVIVVPGTLFSEALKKALEIKNDEKGILNKLENGHSLSNILSLE